MHQDARNPVQSGYKLATGNTVQRGATCRENRFCGVVAPTSLIWRSGTQRFCHESLHRKQEAIRRVQKVVGLELRCARRFGFRPSDSAVGTGHGATLGHLLILVRHAVELR